ncbi:MAG: glucose-6-phosphate isomerase [Phycisphaerales bacterium]|nr:glucose-6-phosphate isomerase [Phycisphaerales bacterium]
MASRFLELDYASALASAVGAAHGLEPAEIQAAQPAVASAIERIENERGSGQHRYRDLPDDKAMIAEIKKTVKRRSPGVENLVVLGIGGSALGNISLQSALNPPYYNLLPAAKRGGPRLFVVDNVDPVQIGALLDLLGPSLKKTLFNVISKSGETAETASQFLIVRDLLARKLGKKKLARNILCTTDPAEGVLRQVADAEGYETLPVPPGVGGRFSVLSAVGLFSAAMCGIRVDRLMQGARAMSKSAAEKRVERNPAAMLALLLHAFYVRGKRMHVMMPYSHQLNDMADWWRQLWAESLGKDQNEHGQPTTIGPTPIRALGATDQHSQVQLYREGPNDKVFVFLEVVKFDRDVKVPKDKAMPDALKYLQGTTLGNLLNAEKAGTEFALVKSRRPCMTIRFPAISEETVGQFIMLWEAATSIAGCLFGINPYDQPAVQLGKDMTYALLGKKGYEQHAAEFRAYEGKRAKARV